MPDIVDDVAGVVVAKHELTSSRASFFYSNGITLKPGVSFFMNPGSQLPSRRTHHPGLARACNGQLAAPRPRAAFEER